MLVDAKGNKIEFKDIKVDDIVGWCVANGEVDWLKAKAKEERECVVYPRKTITIEDGKIKSVADKSKEPHKEMRPISFIQIRNDFVDKFMPELAPKKKDKEPTMYEIIANL
jgi:hypothetical protein